MHSADMDNEVTKTSARANKLEKKRFEMLLASFDAAKRNAAVDIRKSQLDFKRRLSLYRDRQRQLYVTRSGPSSGSFEELFLKQLKRRNHLSQVHSGVIIRPTTSPQFHTDHRGHRQDTVSASRHCVSSTKSAKLHEDVNREDDESVVQLSHCRRSKVDLRPSTAWALTTSSAADSKDQGLRRGGYSSAALFRLGRGSLGTTARQVRYFDEEEINERCAFYRFLLDGYRMVEQQTLERLSSRVCHFCGKPGNKTPSCPALVSAGVAPLPASVPSIVRQALNVISAGSRREV